MDAEGVTRSGLNSKGKRYFAHDCYLQKPSMGTFIFSELMADICRATMGDNAYLFWNQYVVKGADKDSAFSWHQDSGYVNHECPMYLTCWVTLDDVTLENGTVFLLPYSQVGIRTVVQHVMDKKSNDLVGYFGKDPGLPVVVPAGSIAVFSSYVFHRSGPNLTDKMRRIFLPQYSPEIIYDLKGKIWGKPVPFLKNGEIIWKPGDGPVTGVALRQSKDPHKNACRLRQLILDRLGTSLACRFLCDLCVLSRLISPLPAPPPTPASISPAPRNDSPL